MRMDTLYVDTGNEPELAGRGQSVFARVWGRSQPATDISASRVECKAMAIILQDRRYPHLGKDSRLLDNVILYFTRTKFKVLYEMFLPRKSTSSGEDLTDADILATGFVDLPLDAEKRAVFARVRWILALTRPFPVSRKVPLGHSVTSWRVTTAPQRPPDPGQHTEEVLLELCLRGRRSGSARYA